jgi:hypothetical protein
VQISGDGGDKDVEPAFGHRFEQSYISVFHYCFALIVAELTAVRIQRFGSITPRLCQTAHR